MKPPKQILIAGAAALLVLCASAQAGNFNLYTLTGDADSGINADNAYTHAIDVNGNGNTTVNGAVFTSSFGGNPGNQGNIPGTNNYATTGLPGTTSCASTTGAKTASVAKTLKYITSVPSRGKQNFT